MKWTVCLLASLLLAVVDCQVLDIRMHPTTGDTYCGNLQCVANSSLPVIGMTIYDITEKDNPVKLVSISTFAPELSIEQCQIHVINAIGAISKYEGILGINFTKAADCLYGSFQCELDFVDANGQPDVLKANLIGATEQNATVLYKLAEIATELKQHSEVTDVELKALQQDNEILKAMLGSVILELSSVEELLNSTLNTQHDQSLGSGCYRGMPHKNAMEKFLLYFNVLALCDTETDGGGWVVIQRRINGDVDFYRGWNEYKTGFGNLDTSFWLGNNAISLLADQGYNELRIDMIYEGRRAYAHYSNFSVASEAMNYQLTVGAFEGTAGDSLTYHNNKYFSTFDRDNDKDGSYNCAVFLKGAWWYGVGCHVSNLNGLWGVQDSRGMAWHTLTGWNSVSFSEMKVRRG